MNLKAELKYFLILIIAFMVHPNCVAQCTITAPKNICTGNLGYFNISYPSGSTVISTNWDFGDGYTSKFQNTGHLYKKAGFFRVKCKLSLKDGSTCFDSVNVTVLELPKADFTFSKFNPCLPKNETCLTDISKPAGTPQPIITRLVIWDDGTFEKIDSIGCHNYRQEGNFKITLEVTDVMGCKNIKSNEITIIPGPIANYSVNTSSYCGGKKVCIMNSSDTLVNSVNIFTWQFDNKFPFRSSYDTQFCNTYLKNETINIKLTVAGSNGCMDTINQLLNIAVDTIPTIQMVLSDTSVCYGSKITAGILPTGDFKYSWSFNELTDDHIEIDSRKKGIIIGNNVLTCKVIKGNCTLNLQSNFTIRGPKLKIKLFNETQCGVSRKVFFIDSTEVLDYRKSSRLWVLEDSYGDSCICHREKNINKNKNCNFGKDWYHKHSYSVNNSFNNVRFYVYDSLTQCGDFINKNVDTDACGSGGDCVGKGSYCPGDFIIVNKSSNIKPEMFSLDSGKKWFSFPWRIPRGYKGLYSVLVAYNIDSSFISDFGNDSVQIYSDKTKSYSFLYFKNHIFINEGPNAIFSYSLSKECRFKDAFIHLEDSLVKAGETLTINWGDESTSIIKPIKDTIYDTLKHRYDFKVFKDTIRIYRQLANGCKDTFKLPIKFGTLATLDSVSNICFGDSICYNFSVIDFGNDEAWNSANNYGTIKLITGEAKEFSNDYAPCYKYFDTGKKIIYFIATANDGCSDTLSRDISISDVLANVTNASRYFGCGEIKQLFDSSGVLPINNIDPITDYLWDFGKKNNTTTEKDPYHTFSKFGTFTVIHNVITKNGCFDSVKFTVTVGGPEPYFDIADTVACEPFTVVLKNKSKNCTQYYWDFGDPEHNTFLNSDTGDVSFTYTKEGKYYLKLTGIDTFFSSTTQTLYYCNDTFPKISTERSVTVLPFLKAEFVCDDTVCMSEIITIQNLSDYRYKIINWDFGDGSNKSLPNTSFVNYSYKSTGSFKITLLPDYNVMPGIPKCLDTADKVIIVRGTLANFEYERLCDNSPLINFKNTTLPDTFTTQYHWDFGQSDLAENESGEKNPQHDYGFNEGNFKACLNLVDGFGCKDTFCEIIVNDFTSRLLIPNVFTPDLEDEKNDEYDIVMEGEEIYELSIFNRWGQLMYQSKEDCEPGTGTNWNGRINNTGQQCPEGTYFYIFDYKNCYGDLEKKRVTGTITLIR